MASDSEDQETAAPGPAPAAIPGGAAQAQPAAPAAAEPGPDGDTKAPEPAPIPGGAAQAQPAAPAAAEPAPSPPAPDGTTQPQPAAPAAAEPAATSPGPAPGDGTTSPAAPGPTPSPPAPEEKIEFNMSDAKFELSKGDFQFLEYVRKSNALEPGADGKAPINAESIDQLMSHAAQIRRGRNESSIFRLRDVDGRAKLSSEEKENRKIASLESLAGQFEAHVAERETEAMRVSMPPLEMMNPSEATRLAGMSDQEFLGYINTVNINEIDLKACEEFREQALKFNNKESQLFAREDSDGNKISAMDIFEKIQASHKEYQVRALAEWQRVADSKGYKSEMPVFLNEQADKEISRMLQLVNTKDENGVTHTGPEVAGWIANYVNSMPVGPDPADKKYLGKDGQFDEEKFAAASKAFREKYKGIGFREPVRPNVYGGGALPEAGPPARKVFNIDLDEAENQKLDGNMFIPRKGPDGKPIYDPVSGKQIQDIIIFKDGQPKGYHIMDPKEGCAISQETLDKLHEKGIGEGVSKPQAKSDFIDVEYVDNPEKAKEYLEALKKKHGIKEDERVCGDKELKELDGDSSIERKGGRLPIDGEGNEYGVNLDGMRDEAIKAKGNILVKVPRRDENKNQLLDEDGNPVYDLLVIDEKGKIIGGLIQEPAAQTLIKQKDREELQAALKEQYKGREAELAAAMGLTDDARAERLSHLGVDDEGPRHGGEEPEEDKSKTKAAEPMAVDTDELAQSSELAALVQREKDAVARAAGEGRESGLAKGAPDLTADDTRRASLAAELPEEPAPAASPAAPGVDDAERASGKEGKSAAEGVFEHPAGGDGAGSPGDSGEDGDDKKRKAAAKGDVEELDAAGNSRTVAGNRETGQLQGSSAYTPDTTAEANFQDRVEAEAMAARSGVSAAEPVAVDTDDLGAECRIEAGHEERIAEAAERGAQEMSLSPADERAGYIEVSEVEEPEEPETRALSAKGVIGDKVSVVNADGSLGSKPASPEVQAQANAVATSATTTPPPSAAAAHPARTTELQQGQGQEAQAAPPAGPESPKPTTRADDGMARPSTPPSPTAVDKVKSGRSRQDTASF